MKKLQLLLISILIPFTVFGEIMRAESYSFDESTQTLTISDGFSRYSFYGDKNLVLKIVAEEGALLPQNCSSLLDEYFNVTEIDLSKADASEVTSMRSMFYNCINLESITFGDEFSTPQLTDMENIFGIVTN